MQIGVDIGGTFTDVVALAARRAASRSRRSLSTPEDLIEGVAPRSARCSRAPARAGRRRALRPRHHGRHQRHPRAEGRRHRPAHHRRLRGHAGDRPHEALAHVRPGSGPGDAGRSSRRAAAGSASASGSTPDGAGARRRSTRTACARAVRTLRRRRTCEAHRGLLPVLVRQSARTSGARARSSREMLPEMHVSLSSEVDPTFREYERTVRDRLRRLPAARW